MKKHNVFISFKKTYKDEVTLDSKIAQSLYQRLLEEGYTPFFSDEEVVSSGYSAFAHAIDDALNSASILIYVCTNPAFLETPYVKYEWSSFANEIKSGHKLNAHILGFVQGVNFSDIPYGLRSFEIFQVEEMHRLIDAVKKLLPLENKDINPEDLLAAQINRFLGRERNVFQRKEFNQFFEFIIKNRRPLGIITYEKNVDASAIIYHEVLRWHNNDYPILYVDGADDYGIFSRIDVSAFEHLFIVFDKVYKQEQFNFIANLLEISNVTVICAVPKEFINLAAELQHSFSDINYHLDVLNESETLEYVHMIAKEIGLPLAGNLETLLIMPTLKELRTPFVLKLVLSSIKNYKGYADQDYNITDIFEIIENSLIRDYEGIDIVIETLFSLILRKRINRVMANEVKEHEDLMQVLATKSLVKKTHQGYVISNAEYLYYRLALTLFNEKGLMVTDQDFLMIEDAKPYYSYLAYLETRNLPTAIINGMNDAQKEKFLSLMISEEEMFVKLVGMSTFEKALNELLIRFRKSGLFKLANIIIEACETNNIPSTNQFDYLAEKLLIHYFQTGQYLNIDANLWKTKYHQAYVHFCTDELEKSEILYNEAFELMLKENIYNISLLFDYMELLLDAGKKDKVKDILEIATENCDAEDDEYIIRYNVLKGNIYQDELSFSMSEVHFRQALKKALEVFNLKRIQICYGELGRLLIYMGKYDEALLYLRKNLEIAQSLSDFNGMAISTKMIALIQILMGKYEKAYKYYGYAEMYAELVNNYWRLFKARLFLDILDYGRKEKYQRDIEELSVIKSENFQATALPLVAVLKAKMNEPLDDVLAVLAQAAQSARNTQDLKSELVAKIIKSALIGQKQEVPLDMEKYAQDLVRAVNDLLANKEKKFYVPLPNFQYRKLTGKRIELRSIDVKYMEDIFEYTSNVANTKFVMWQRHRDYKDTYAFIESVYDLEKAGQLLTWVIYHLEDEKVIGTVDLSYSEEFQAVEIGYIVNMNYWQKGYASEAVSLVLDFARNYLDINKIVGVAMTENLASKKVLLKHGFKFERIIEGYHNKPDIADKTGSLFVLQLR